MTSSITFFHSLSRRPSHQRLCTTCPHAQYTRIPFFPFKLILLPLSYLCVLISLSSLPYQPVPTPPLYLSRLIGGYGNSSSVGRYSVALLHEALMVKHAQQLCSDIEKAAAHLGTSLSSSLIHAILLRSKQNSLFSSTKSKNLASSCDRDNIIDSSPHRIVHSSH